MGLIYFERIIWITPLAQINSGICSSLPTQVLTKAPETSLLLPGILEPRHLALALEKEVLLKGIGLALFAYCHAAPRGLPAGDIYDGAEHDVPTGDRPVWDGCVFTCSPCEDKGLCLSVL